MLLFKPGVSLKGLVPQMVVALQVAEGVFREVVDAPCVVTSANDSVHGANSLHYEGRAVDLRVKHLIWGDDNVVSDRIRGILAPLGFDVLLEAQGTDNAHLHIELDRVKAGY